VLMELFIETYIIYLKYINTFYPVRKNKAMRIY